tara:strand:+ start:28 stop:948 length:921 start_codon:yes stop_codon:yes gene_type:complete
MNNIFDKLKKNLYDKDITLILPESKDSRIVEATKRLKCLGFNILNIDDYKNNDLYISYLLSRKFTNNWPKDEIVKYLDDPLNKGLTMVACGEADGLVAGAITSTSDVLRSSLRIIGIENSAKWLSSFFLMISNENQNQNQNIFSFADCAVIPEPNVEQLVSIAENTSKMHELITKELPKVAFLSFSTKGSANHYRVEKVQKAYELFTKRNPNICCDGEIQFDAAISPSISRKKIKNSNINGNANVFIFPNLDAGNISYKITRELGKYSACGPLLIGLNKPVHDLSRSCSVEDIVNVATIAAIQKSS